MASPWRDYHEATKHSAESLRRAPHTLDWANMPDPFRHYEGVPVLDMPAGVPTPGAPALAVLQGVPGSTQVSDGAMFLSQLLFHTAAISASKVVPQSGYRYALRVNPSSGNLHPTEFHFATSGLKGWPDGLYHYRVSSHMAEQRARGNFTERLGLTGCPLVFLLTTIAWREAWKYRQRAFRYCLHDTGHAWQALALAARALGCESHAKGQFSDEQLAQICGLAGDEWPMLLGGLRSATIPLEGVKDCEPVWFGGEPNVLSTEVIEYSQINAIYRATKVERTMGTVQGRVPPSAGVRGISLPAPASSIRSFGEVARQRRSALDFRGGGESMSLAELAAILDAAAQKQWADFSTVQAVQLYLYAHRVDGLEPGVYRHWPDQRALELLKPGDQKVAAAGLSLGQDLAGNACVAFSMIADLERMTAAFGDRGYRYAHFEAGAIGQCLYLAAEALGLRATGIGAFFDNRVHDYLGLAPEDGQVIYHFAIGHPVHDPRLDAGSY